MIHEHVCDVDAIYYYGIFVVPEARLYEFVKGYNIENAYRYNISQAYTCETTVNDHRFKFFDDLVLRINNLQSSMTNSLAMSFSNDRRLLTNNMSLLRFGRYLSVFDEDFASAAHNIKWPFFTSAEKAKEFLIDLTRILYTDTTTYVEFLDPAAVLREPAELSIVKYSLPDLLQLSRLNTIVINPYVPGFV